jgi:hypothetical protein
MVVDIWESLPLKKLSLHKFETKAVTLLVLLLWLIYILTIGLINSWHEQILYKYRESYTISHR